MKTLIDTARQAQPNQFDLDDGAEISIGRDDTCDIVIASDTVSRRHAMVSAVGGRLIVYDLGSSNGTRIDGKVVSQAQWKQDQVLEIGPARFALAQSLDEQATVVNRPPRQRSQSNDRTARQIDDRQQDHPAKGNFISRHWRGEYGLLQSYLVNVLLISLIVLSGLLVATLSLAPSLSRGTLMLLLITNAVISVAISVWQVTGVVRSLMKATSLGLSIGLRVLCWVLLLVPIALTIFVLLAWLGAWIRFGDPAATAVHGPGYRLTERENTWDRITDYGVRTSLPITRRSAISRNAACAASNG